MVTNTHGKIGRLLFICGFFTISFLYLFYVLYKIQIVNNDKYSNSRKLQNDYVSKQSKRGTIYATFKNGELAPLSYDETYYKLVISPRDISKDYEESLFATLNEITSLRYESFINKVRNKQDAYEELKIISNDERVKIESLGLPGVITYETFKRKYPFESIGSRIIGFYGGSENGFSGRYGLEKYYERDLQGKESATVSFFTRIFENRESSEQSEEKFSKNIVTTLEPNVMKFTWDLLKEMKENWEADQTSMIIMDTKSGAILAMETYPGFDPNNYKDYDVGLFGNPSVQGVFELGSIMKPITLSGAIEMGLISPTTVYKDYGFVKVDNYTIKNFDEKVRGDQTMQDVISNSLNTGAVYVQKLMGKEKFRENFASFGLEEQTGIDFPGEVFDKTDNLDTDTDVNFATAAFGQGVAITPIAMLSALNIIPNDGKRVCPHFLDEKVLQNGTSIKYDCDKKDIQAISSTTAKTMNNMMVELIDSGLAGGRYKDKNYKVGAKTGTAQLPSPDGKYYKDKFIHSYFTYFPAENPRFSVLIYQVNPKKGMLASLTLAPYASKIKDFLLSYYNIPPDR